MRSAQHEAPKENSADCAPNRSDARFRVDRRLFVRHRDVNFNHQPCCLLTQRKWVHSPIRAILYAKDRTVEVCDARSAAAVPDATVWPPDIVPGQFDVLPTQWREMGQQLFGKVSLKLLDGFFQVDRVPEHNRGNNQAEAILSGAVGSRRFGLAVRRDD